MTSGATNRNKDRIREGVCVAVRGSVLVAIWCASLALVATAQSSAPAPAGLRTDRLDRPDAISAPPDANAQMLSRQRRLRREDFNKINAIRRQQIGDASDKLLVLSVDLKNRIERVGNEPVPMIVIREAEVIEQLAREIQHKMALAVGTD